MQTKRYQAQKRNSTTYVYDYVDLFREAVMRRWRVYASANPSADVPSGNRAFKATELVVNRNDQLVEDRRAPGNNDVGMVAWRLFMRTPEAPDGREMIVIANDITFVSGSFSPKEDKVFKLASQLARESGLPRLYIAVNSGARIGLAKEIMSRFKVRHPSRPNPFLGFECPCVVDLACCLVSYVLRWAYHSLITCSLLLGGLVL
jgi:acetyl-CoA carboxylase/biotin carboxylase 1